MPRGSKINDAVFSLCASLYSLKPKRLDGGASATAPTFLPAGDKKVRVQVEMVHKSALPALAIALAIAFLCGGGIAGTPPGALGFSPEHPSFGNQVFGVTGAASLPVKIRIVNPASSPAVSGVAAAVAGANVSDFQVLSDGCTGATLAPGAACIVTIVFSPTALGPRSAALTVSDSANAKAASVPLVGAGVPGRLGVTPGPILFGRVRTGTASASRTIRLRNPNPVALKIDSIKAPPGFSASQGCVGQLAAFATCQVSVIFMPAQAANLKDTPFNGSVAIADDAAKSPQSVAVTGTAFGAPPPPPAITSISGASPNPLTPIQLSTANVDPKSPLSVQFFSSRGFSITEQPIRVASDGTVTAAVPLYIDPASGQVTSGTVSLTLTQVGRTSAPMPLTIQDLPALSTYGTPLGQITHAFLAFEAMLLEGNLGQLQAAQPVLPATVNTSAAQATLTDLLQGAIEARDDVDLMMANNSRVFSWGTQTGGGAITFDATSLDMMDRVLGQYLVQQFGGLVGGPPAPAMATFALFKTGPAVQSASSIIASLLIDLGQDKAVESIEEYLQQLAPEAADSSVSTLDGLTQAVGPSLSLAGPSLGLLSGLTTFQEGVDNLLHSTLATANCLAGGCTVAQQTAIEGSLNGSAAQIFSGDVQAILASGGFAKLLQGNLSTGSGMLSLMQRFAGEGVAGIENADNAASNLVSSGDLKRIFIAPDKGLGQVTTAANITQATAGVPAVQSSLDYCCVTASLGITGICDLSGNCSVWVPLGVPGTDYSAQTLSVVDPISGSTLGSETVDLQSLTPASPVQAAPLQGACNDTDGSTPDGDDPDCD
jgi:hypothetical protein